MASSPPRTPTRRAALDENRRAIEETATLAAAGAPGSAPVLVLVAGGLPEGDRDLPGARTRAADAIAALVDDAACRGRRARDRADAPDLRGRPGVISTLGQALDVAEQFPAETVGVVVDTFHVWWDPQLAEQVAPGGRPDRRVPGVRLDHAAAARRPARPRDDGRRARRLRGRHRGSSTAAGYRGDVEVEIFNQAIWDADPAEVARRTATSFATYVGPSVTPS